MRKVAHEINLEDDASQANVAISAGGRVHSTTYLSLSSLGARAGDSVEVTFRLKRKRSEGMVPKSGPDTIAGVGE